jgi:hypothetical protein
MSNQQPATNPSSATTYAVESDVSMTPEDEIELLRQMAPCMHCGFEPAPEQRREFPRDSYRPTRRAALLDEVKERRGTERLKGEERFSSGFIVEEAAHRYFMLVRDAQEKLKGMFTKAEFITMLNVECGPVWQWDVQMPMAIMVADNNGVQHRDVAEGTPLRSLLDKLIGLSPVENAVLVDACERVWRGHENPLLPHSAA